MVTRDEPRLTPAGRFVLEATYRGRVSYLTGPQEVVMRLEKSREFLDVTSAFAGLARAGWAFIQPFDEEEPPVPVTVPCRTTVMGEDVLAEAAAAAKKRKANKR